MGRMEVPISLWAQGLVLAWYRVRRLGPEFPAAGPVLLVANHNTGMCDAGLMMHLSGSARPLRFLVKYKLMSVPLLGWIVRAAGCIPVYRKQDKVDTSKNADSFAAAYEQLAKGEVITIFPEGTSRNATELRELKSGVARIALGAEAKHGFGLGVRILPVGTHCPARDRWRSRCDLWVGEAIDVRDFAEQHASQPRAAARALMERLEAALRAVTVNVESPEDLALVQMAERCTPPDGRTSTERRVELARHLGALDLEDPTAAKALRNHSADALAADPNAGRPGEIDGPQPLPRWPALLAALVLGAAWLPAALVVLLLGRVLGPTPDKRTSVALMISTLVFPAWTAFLLVWGWGHFGWATPLFVGLSALGAVGAAWIRGRRPPADAPLLQTAELQLFAEAAERLIGRAPAPAEPAAAQ